MEIKRREITVEELSKDYQDSQEEGVSGFGGKLNIRPQYQREFIYEQKERDAVINTVTKDFPLNLMYWSVRRDGNYEYEIIDGQQRTISICQYVAGDFSIDGLAYHNLPNDKQKQILDYKMMIYLCSGKDSEKLDWFRTINIAGKPLTDQELLNAVYSGPWVSDAKRYFSKPTRPKIADDYLKGSAIRQEFLETAIDWISKGKIEEYMDKNAKEPNANELWLYFQKVISWIKVTFPKYRKEMKGVAWGPLFNEFENKKLNSKKLEEEITELMQDDEVRKKSGIYQYVLTNDEKHLNIRSFTDSQKREVYERQKGICKKCKKHFEINKMEADHIDPWHKGGKTISENCQMLCQQCNRRKSGK